MTATETTETGIAGLALLQAGAGSSAKAESAFRTISEVSIELDIPQHVLRFWETKFTQIHPVKRNGGRRYYRPEDIELLRRIKHLLYNQGYTIRGVQKVLRKSHTQLSTEESAEQDRMHEGDSRDERQAEAADLTQPAQDIASESEDAAEFEGDEPEEDFTIADSAAESAPRVELTPPYAIAAQTLEEKERLMARAMARLQPLSHLTSAIGAYPVVGKGTVPTPRELPIGSNLPPKPAAMLAAAGKSLPPAPLLAGATGSVTQPVAATIQAQPSAAPPAPIQRYDTETKIQLQSLLMELRQLQRDVASLASDLAPYSCDRI